MEKKHDDDCFLRSAMSTGDCFRCHQPGHWAANCPLKTTTKLTTTAAAASPPDIHCPCNGGACNVLTSTTKKNPNRRFYTCPSCGFFKWCDQVSIIKSESISVHPTCPCGSGPCRRVTVIDGPNAQRSYFVCSIKKVKKRNFSCFSLVLNLILKLSLFDVFVRVLGLVGSLNGRMMFKFNLNLNK